MSTDPYAAAPLPDAAADGARAARPRRTWDLVLSIALLLLLLAFTAIAAFAGAFLAFASDSCSADSCNYGALNAGILIAMISPVVIALVAIIATVLLLVRRRLAFWAPLVAFVLITAVWIGAAILVGSAVEGWTW